MNKVRVYTLKKLTVYSLQLTVVLLIIALGIFAFTSSVSAQTNASGKRVFSSEQEVNQQDEASCNGFYSGQVGSFLFPNSSNQCRSVTWDSGICPDFPFGFCPKPPKCKIGGATDASNCQVASQPQAPYATPPQPPAAAAQSGSQTYNMVLIGQNAGGEDVFEEGSTFDPNWPASLCNGYISIQGSCKWIHRHGSGPFGAFGQVCQIDSGSNPSQDKCQIDSPAPATPVPATPQPRFLFPNPPQPDQGAAVPATPQPRFLFPNPPQPDQGAGAPATPGQCVLPANELYDCSGGYACFNDYTVDKASCTRIAQTPQFHCDNPDDPYILPTNTKVKVSDVCSGRGSGWVGLEGCGSRQGERNNVSVQYDCSNKLRCFNEFYRDDRTSCRWTPRENTTPTASGDRSYIGRTYHCDPAPECTGQRGPTVIRPEYMEDYKDAIRDRCRRPSGNVDLNCYDAVIVNCLNPNDPSKNLNNDPENGEKLRECVEVQIEAGKAQTEKNIAGNTVLIYDPDSEINPPLPGGTSTAKSQLELDMNARASGNNTTRVYLPGTIFDFGARLYNYSAAGTKVLGKNQNGCVNLAKQNQILFKLDGKSIAQVPPCHLITGFPMPNEPGAHTLTATFPGDDNIGPARAEIMFFITGEPIEETAKVANVKGVAHINGSTSLTISEGDPVWVGGRIFTGVDNCSIQDDVKLTLYQVLNAQGAPFTDLSSALSSTSGHQFNIVYRKERAQNCQSYPAESQNGDPLKLERGVYTLFLDYPSGDNVFRPDLFSPLGGDRNAILVVNEKATKKDTVTKIGVGDTAGVNTKAIRKISLQKQRNVAGISVQNLGGNQVLITNDPSSSKESLILTPCTTLASGTPAEIAAIHLFAQRINDNGEHLPPLIDNEVPNCTTYSIPIDNLAQLDRIEVVASYNPSADSPYGASSADLVIDESDTEKPVAAEEFVELDSFPEEITKADTEAQITASSNEAASNPTFVITYEDGKTEEIAAEPVNEDCSAEAGICTYTTDLYDPATISKIEFCAATVCDVINVDQIQLEDGAVGVGTTNLPSETEDYLLSIEMETSEGRFDISDNTSFEITNLGQGGFASIVLTYASGKQRLLTYYFEASQPAPQSGGDNGEYLGCLDRSFTCTDGTVCDWYNPESDKNGCIPDTGSESSTPQEVIQETPTGPAAEQLSCPDNCNLIDGACWEGPLHWDQFDQCPQGFDSYTDGCWRIC